MDRYEIDRYLDPKIMNNQNKIVISYFEMKVERDLTNDQIDDALYFMKTKLENFNYKVYKTGEEYTYNNENCIVEINELLVALKKDN